MISVPLIALFSCATPKTPPTVAADPDAPPPMEQVLEGPGADAERSKSGLAWVVLDRGPEGPSPVDSARVTVHYTAWTMDGVIADSTLERGGPATFSLRGAPTGWREGLPMMRVGDRFKFWIPPELAYENAPGQPQGMIVLEVALLDFANPRPVPVDVAGIPEGAQVTASGLAWRALGRGDGTYGNPWETATVTVNYAGWTTDGEQFDSSWDRGTPATFGLDQVIDGWTEALQLMQPGDTFRFWVPGNLAYEGRAGPQGMLVFDIELLAYE